ncbi:Bug family tripartite tricarboxylate transporter substrate binding protein [Pseudaquabacterium rugosum]|uniref:Tripartite tricarboxylate transporter substrate binding protein n=1 Tax=Pseudaquabacterium rugosum TaxID=2984194 RepID=A0ABU9BBT8_9BURK
MRRRHLLQALPGCALLPALSTLSNGSARAATASAPAGWPQRPVTWILSQPPGSGPDNVARLLTERLARHWGQAVVVDNKPGGQNTIGAQAAARLAPDGHGFYFATTAALVTNPLLFKSLPYDPQRDFTPVAFVARSPFAVLVAGDSPVRTLDELIARAKARGGALALGNEGPRTFSGMIARLLNARSGMNANLVPYASVGVGTQDLMGGHVDAMVADLAATAALARQGRLRVLATTAGRRVAGWESVSTLAERWPGLEMVGWFALVAPAGSPTAVIERVNRDVQALQGDAELATRIAAIGPLVEPGLDLAQTAAVLQTERQRWTALAREIGVLPE